MKTRIVLFTALLAFSSAFSQQWEYHWAERIASLEDEDEAMFVRIDSDDNVYVALEYQGAITVGDTDYPTPADNGRDILVVKYDEAGNVLWSGNIAGEGSASGTGNGDLLEGMEVDPDGNLIIIGNLGNGATILGVETNYLNDPFDLPGNRNFVAKISPSGELVWHVVRNGSVLLNDYFTALHIDGDGNAYVAASNENSGNEYEIIGAGGSEVSSAENTGLHLFKLNSDGAVQWLDPIPYPGAKQLAVDGSGDILYSAHAADVDDDVSETGHYLIKLDGETRETIWTRFSNTEGFYDDRELGLYVNADNSIIHFHATDRDVIDFGDGFSVDSEFNDLGVLWKVDSDGQTTSVLRVADLFDEPYYSVDALDNMVTVQSFAMKNDNQFYLACGLEDAATLADGTVLTPSEGLSPSIASSDALLLQINSDFTVQGVSFEDGGAHQRGMDVAPFSNGDAALLGHYSSGTYYGSALYGDIELEPLNNSKDMFLTRITPGFPESNGLEEMASNFDFKQYPVPASEFLNISFENSLSAKATIAILDITGRIVAQESAYGNGMVKVKMDVSKIPSGMYFTRITIGENSFGKKLIITK